MGVQPDLFHIGLNDGPRCEFICHHGSDEPCLVQITGRDNRGYLCGTGDQMRAFAHQILEALERAAEETSATEAAS